MATACRLIKPVSRLVEREIQLQRRSAPAATAGPKVVFVNRVFYPNETATAQLLTDLTRHLAADHRVMVVTGAQPAASARAGSQRREWIGGVEVHRLWGLSRGGNSVLAKLVAFLCFYPAAFLALVRLLRAGDLVVAKTDPPLLCVVASMAARLRRAATANWLQDLYPEVAIRLEVPLVQGSVGRLLVALRNHALQQARMNVVIGELMASELQRQGLPARRIRIIPNWADERSIHPVESSVSKLRESWQVAKGTVIVGYSGNLGRAHEVETIAGAAMQLKHRDDVRFVFIGGGPTHARLNDLVAQGDLENCIFVPHQPYDALADALAAADVHWLSLQPRLEGLIVPSKFYGIIAAGRPVIAITALDGEIAKIVRDHRCGFVVEPGDIEGLVRVIEMFRFQPGLRREMGERARGLAVCAFARRKALERWSLLISELLTNDQLSWDPGPSTRSSMRRPCGGTLKDDLLAG